VNCSRTFSEYYNGLKEDAKRRYVEKLDSISTEMNDPYTFPPNMIRPADSFPDLQYPDIFNYLVNMPSVYTKDDLKAYKSLDAYKYLLAGWVGNVSIHIIEDRMIKCRKFIIRAKVRHSQSVNATPLLPLVAVNNCGSVICSHCTCMAGLGEAIISLYCLLLKHTIE
jgi:hypothetical protein